MNKLYKIAILSYSTGGVTTGIYVNNNLKKKTKINRYEINSIFLKNLSRFMPHFSILSKG